MPSIGTSSYAADGTPDTVTSLASGLYVTTTLRDEIDDAETEFLFVEDGSGASKIGLIVVDDEAMLYDGRLGLQQFNDLERGYLGTTPATHTAGATVKIFPPPTFINPALAEAIIAAQETIIAQAALITALDARVADLEGA